LFLRASVLSTTSVVRWGRPQHKLMSVGVIAPITPTHATNGRRNHRRRMFGAGSQDVYATAAAARFN